MISVNLISGEIMGQIQPDWQFSLQQQREHASSEQLLMVIELLGTVVEQSTFQGAATALATKIANMFECDRVSIGWLNKKHVDVVALSHAAHFEEKTNLVRTIGQAQSEALDQHCTILYPQPDDAEIKMTKMHAQLAKDDDCDVICTLPLAHDKQLIGAITFERMHARPFDRKWIEICEMACSLVGPILKFKKEEEKWIGARVKDSFKDLCARFIGPGYIWWKIIGGIIGLTIISSVLFKGNYLVTADAQLEGSIQRVVSAPIDGFIAQTHAKAGDVVKEGQVLGTLDDADLSLELMKLDSEKRQVENEYREAFSKRDRTQVAILSAKTRQIEAKMKLINAQLERIQFKAPFTGVIIEGDLDQALGAPVEKGQVLFKMAPLESYRIILNIDETDINAIANEQHGHLVLSSMPGKKIAFKVKRITPVSVSEDGKNFFRVEAILLEKTDLLRPGMEGIAKIEAGEARYIWLWTHKMFNWIRLKAWQWGL